MTTSGLSAMALTKYNCLDISPCKMSKSQINVQMESFDFKCVCKNEMITVHGVPLGPFVKWQYSFY